MGQILETLNWKGEKRRIRIEAACAERPQRRQPYKRAPKTGKTMGRGGKTTPFIDFEQEVKEGIR